MPGSPDRGFELYTRAKQLTLDIATEVFMGADPGRRPTG